MTNYKRTFLLVFLMFSCVNNKKIFYTYSEWVNSVEILGKESSDDWQIEGQVKKIFKIDITNFENNWRTDSIGALGFRYNHKHQISGILEKLKLIRIDSSQFFKRMGQPNLKRESEHTISLFYNLCPPCIEPIDENNSKKHCCNRMMFFICNKEDAIVTGPICIDG